jgi:hypothetical protein
MGKLLEYRSFESLQNAYDYQEETSFFAETLNGAHCFSRHLLVNRFLNTKKPKFLFWSIEADSNVITDPFCVETINHWRNLLSVTKDDSHKIVLSTLLKNVGLALSRNRNLSNSYHYDSGFVNNYNDKDSYISFEVHPPRRCFRLVENFEKIINKINQIKILGLDLKIELEAKYQVKDLNVNFSDSTNISAQVISKAFNNTKKNSNDKTDLFLTPFIAEAIYKDAKTFTLGLEYIVDTFQIVDYWSPDKKR